MLYPGIGTVDGRLGDHLLIAPAYLSTEDELKLLVDTMYQAIEQVFEEIHREESQKWTGIYQYTTKYTQ